MPLQFTCPAEYMVHMLDQGACCTAAWVSLSMDWSELHWTGLN